MEEKNNFFIRFKDNKLAGIAASILLGASLFLVAIVYGQDGQKTAKADLGAVEAVKPDPFAGISLIAKGAYVIDIKDNKPLYAKNPDKPYPLASVTKLMTALSAVSLVPEYTVVEISGEHLREDGDTGLFVNERWKMGELSNFTLTVSSNDAAAAIASVVGSILNSSENRGLPDREIFIGEMNKLAQKIGLRNSQFLNESGLDLPDGEPGAVGSARDMVELMSYIMKNYPEILDATRHKDRVYTSLDGIEHYASNTNNGVTNIPGILASKTGFTDMAGGNLVVVFDPYLGRPIAIAILGSTYDGRFEDVHKLVEASIEYIKNNQ